MSPGRFLLLGVVGAVLLIVGAVTMAVGIAGGERETIHTAVIELTGGFMFALLGFSAYFFFRHAAADRNRKDAEG